MTQRRVNLTGMVTVSTQRLSIHPLRAIRSARGLPLRTVASRAQIDPGHLSKVERGQSHLSVQSLYRLAVVLELRELADSLRPYATGSMRSTRNNGDGAGGATPTPLAEKHDSTV